MDSINIKSSDYNMELIKKECHPQNDEINVNDDSVDNNINCVGVKPCKCSSSREKLQSDGLDCCGNVVSIKTETESDWVEKHCKSGELLYHYNKVSGEKQWPPGGAHRVSDNQRDKNHTLLSGTSPYSPYMGVPHPDKQHETRQGLPLTKIIASPQMKSTNRNNFDIEKGSGTEFEEVAEMLSLKKKDLKKKGFGNKPNTAQPIEDEDVQKMWESGAVDGGERDPYQAFIEYLNRRPKGDNVPSCFFLSPVDNPKTNIWYKKSPVGVNALRKMMATIKSTAGIQGKFTNSSGRKTAIQSPRGEFSPLEIAELTGHANSDSISSYSHNPLEKQRRISNKLAGYTPAITATNTIVTSATH
ncbi:hypothetical protein QZH41_001762 [Actinostola sp. cb2023]|nr:hypothetical protein QZH41_001762 [Actinostola sp. cb2023]